MIEKYREQIKSSEEEIKASGLKDLPLDAIEKVSGGGGFSAWGRWPKEF